MTVAANVAMMMSVCFILYLVKLFVSIRDFFAGMESRLCCLVWWLVAFIFRRIEMPPPFKHLINSIPNGNLSCLYERKNSKYRANRIKT